MPVVVLYASRTLPEYSKTSVCFIRQAQRLVSLSIVLRHMPSSESVKTKSRKRSGAGKTQTLLWIRRFFEEICGWTHGQEFVFCASQNSMTALINGVTLHSFFKLVFKHKDGTPVNVQNDDKTDMAQDYIRFQALRFIFIDEFSTAGIEMFAEINFKTTQHIRKNNTWSLRKVSTDISDRPFGGLNLVVSGDAWQFGPVGSCGAVFDNPTRMRCVSSYATISAMFSI